MNNNITMFKNRYSYKINDVILDKYQIKAVTCKNKSCLVIAGAGSGKTLTMIAKIKYLIEERGAKEQDIICMSFTNESVNSLKLSIQKNGYFVDVKTFHKLSLDILEKKNFSISAGDTLEYLVNEYFSSYIDIDNNFREIVILYLGYYYNNPSISRCSLYLRRTIVSFINIFKAYNYDIQLLISMIKNRKIDKIDRLLLVIIYYFYIMYDNELSSQGEIDFNDMINLARKEINQGTFLFKYKYIIIDEYQDTSYIRYNLIKELIDKFNVELTVVGDDYQSIYSFTGCSLDIFVNFKRFFKNASIIKLRNTYRNPKDIVDISSRFVMKNKRQIRKKLKSNKYLNESIVVCYLKDYRSALIEIIKNIPKDKNIMILGRNNNDINLVIDDNILKKENNNIIYNDMNIKFLTVHTSKGLESDYVIVLNVVDDTLGFPNKIKEFEVIKYLNIEKRNIIYEEERRLFYVALTRTKNKVYLCTLKNKESLFIKEILRDYKKKIKIINFE